MRSVGDAIIPELGRAARGFATGTLSGNVDAADTADVEASIVVTRLGRCAGNRRRRCRGERGLRRRRAPCIDPIPDARASARAAPSPTCGPTPSGTFAGVVVPQGHYELRVSAPERDDVVVSRRRGRRRGDTAVDIPP